MMFASNNNTMSEKDVQYLMELAKNKLEAAKYMTKVGAIASLNEAGILTKKGKFTKNYRPLQEIILK